jgi:outer membrane protein assembly factor BamB
MAAAVSGAQGAPSETRVYQADDAHTGRLVGAGLGGSLAPAWSLDTHFMVFTPLISDGTAYVTTHPGEDWHGPTELTALDLTTGARKWSTQLVPGQLGGDDTYLASDGVRVYAVVWDRVYALDAQTGAVVWQAGDGQWVPSPPILHDGALIFQSAGYGATLYAFRATDGAPLWHTAGGDGPVVAAGQLGFMAGDCQNRLAVNLATGSQAYLQYGSCVGGSEYPAAFDGRYIWAADPDATDPGGFVYDPTDGTAVDALEGWPPAIAAPYAYTVRVDRLVALSLDTRAQAWTTQLDSAIVAAPLVTDGEVVVRTHGSVYLLNRMTGAVTWRQPVTYQQALYLNTGSEIGLAAGDGYLIVPTDGHIDVLRAGGLADPESTDPQAKVALLRATADSTSTTVRRRAGTAPGAVRRARVCHARSITLARELATAVVRAGHRVLVARRRAGRLHVVVPTNVAHAGVAHLTITGRTRSRHRARRHRSVQLCWTRASAS